MSMFRDGGQTRRASRLGLEVYPITGAMDDDWVEEQETW